MSLARGIVQCYRLAADVYRLDRLHWVMQTSLLKTLAGKYDSTVTKMAHKYRVTIETAHGPQESLQVNVEREFGRGDAGKDRTAPRQHAISPKRGEGDSKTLERPARLELASGSTTSHIHNFAERQQAGAVAGVRVSGGALAVRRCGSGTVRSLVRVGTLWRRRTRWRIRPARQLR